MRYRTDLQSRRKRYAAAVENTKPMSDLNITPLIDVMLVLLVMMILTIPIATHEMSVPLPGPSVVKPEQTQDFTLMLSRDGRVYWNDEPVNKVQLGTKLKGLTAYEKPLLKFQSDPRVRYEDFAQHIKLVKDSGVKNVAFTGLSTPQSW